MADPYVTADEYIATFGERETKLLTNTTDGAGAIDTQKVEEAISDASQEVEAYAAARYLTPFSSAPPVLKGWVKGIARYKLYLNTGRMNSAVQDAYNSILAQLNLLSQGKIKLSVAEVGDDPLPTAGIGYASSSCDRPSPVISGNPALAQFTEPFTGGCYDPRWRRLGGE